MASPQPQGNDFRDYLSVLCAILLGVGCLYALFNMTSSWWKARSWDLVEAKLYATTTREKEQVRYTYMYDYHVGGTRYRGHAISFSFTPFASKSDARILERAIAARPLTVWVSPQEPSESVLDKSFMWTYALGWLLSELILVTMPFWYLRQPRPKWLNF